MSILEARGVYKTYVTRGVETAALRGVDLRIEEGEFSVLGAERLGQDDTAQPVRCAR